MQCAAEREVEVSRSSQDLTCEGDVRRDDDKEPNCSSSASPQHRQRPVSRRSAVRWHHGHPTYLFHRRISRAAAKQDQRVSRPYISHSPRDFAPGIQDPAGAEGGGSCMSLSCSAGRRAGTCTSARGCIGVGVKLRTRPGNMKVGPRVS